MSSEEFDLEKLPTERIQPGMIVTRLATQSRGVVDAVDLVAGAGARVVWVWWGRRERRSGEGQTYGLADRWLEAEWEGYARKLAQYAKMRELLWEGKLRPMAWDTGGGRPLWKVWEEGEPDR